MRRIGTDDPLSSAQSAQSAFYSWLAKKKRQYKLHRRGVRKKWQRCRNEMQKWKNCASAEEAAHKK